MEVEQESVKVHSPRVIVKSKNVKQGQALKSGHKSFWKWGGGIIGGVLLVALLLNYQYAYKHLKFRVKGPEVVNGIVERSVVQSASSSLESVVPAVETMEKDTLFIESLGIVAPIIYPEEKSEEEFQRALRYGVVQYPGTAPVGQPGNTYIFGHSSDYPWSEGDYKTIFALLPNIKDEALIKVSNHAGEVYTYKVVDQFVAEKTDTKLLTQDRSKKQLTLQTSYPIGSALKRYIVIAVLEK